MVDTMAVDTDAVTAPDDNTDAPDSVKYAALEARVSAAEDRIDYLYDALRNEIDYAGRRNGPIPTAAQGGLTL